MFLAISWLALGIVLLGLLYWYLLVVGALLSAPRATQKSPATRFAISIPAHDEADVIASTVQQAIAANYPLGMVTVFVVADHCTDDTAANARSAGAIVFEREEGERGSKGSALRWLLQEIRDAGSAYDAYVIIDADSKLDPDFLRYMDQRLQAGESAVQGNHVISNPDDGWFPALTRAMFLIDNRFQNLGRAGLGLSAKNMGDAICFRTSILNQFGWGEGLTEDYAFRQRLLLEGIRIVYEPRAVSYGQAPWNWQIARKQRLRWIRGVQVAGSDYRLALWRKGWKSRSPAMIEGALQTCVPSYSTLALLSAIIWLLHVLLALLQPSGDWTGLLVAWTISTLLLFVYPLIGLALEKAPLKAFVVILTGPIFILWRTWLNISARLGITRVSWARTPHRKQT